MITQKDADDLRHISRVLSSKGFVELPLKCENIALRIEADLSNKNGN